MYFVVFIYVIFRKYIKVKWVFINLNRCCYVKILFKNCIINRFYFYLLIILLIGEFGDK